MSGGKKPGLTEAELDLLLVAAARDLELLIPTTPEEVAIAEQLQSRSIETVPEWVKDPKAFVSKVLGSRPTPKPRSASTDPVATEALARAAREGTGEIPPDVAERMRRDRERARKK